MHEKAGGACSIGKLPQLQTTRRGPSKASCSKSTETLRELCVGHVSRALLLRCEIQATKSVDSTRVTPFCFSSLTVCRSALARIRCGRIWEGEVHSDLPFFVKSRLLSEQIVWLRVGEEFVATTLEVQGGGEMAGEMMKAVQYSSYGGGGESLKINDVPKPVPKNGELLVKVEAAGINPVDWKIQKGMLRPFLPAKFPHTPGIDATGEVVSVGTNAGDFATGDKVVSFKKAGSYAQYAIVQSKTTAKRPPEVSAVDAAGLPCAGLTALQALTNSGVNMDGSYSGNVLVTGGAGGVGLYAVQLAKLSGAHVTTTAGERNIQLLKDMGADEVLDYKTDEGAKLLSPSGKKYDVVVNGADIKWATLLPQLSPTAQVQELTPNAGAIANSVFKKITMAKQKRSPFLPSPNEKDLAFLADLVAKGKLKTVVEQTYPIENVAEAWSKSIDGHCTGKLILTLD